MSIVFPPVLELEFDTVVECEEFKRAAATQGMSPDEFVLWLFASYQRTVRRDNVRDMTQFVARKQNATTIDIDALPRKPMARAEVKRVLLEAVRDLLEEAG